MLNKDHRDLETRGNENNDNVVNSDLGGGINSSNDTIHANILIFLFSFIAAIVFHFE